MNLDNNKSWLLSIFATVALFTSGSIYFSNDNVTESEMIQFSDLSDADVDAILAVKARMHDAKDQSNKLAFN
jgi:hypothetical protein